MLVGTRAEDSLAETAAYFRITGGVVWTQPEFGPLATYTEECWRHREALWPGMIFHGPCRLVFGLPRDPVSMSEPLQSLTIYGRILSANGVPFAVFEPAQDMWHGAHTWWHAFRVESTELRQSTVRLPAVQSHLLELPHALEHVAHKNSLS